MKNFMRDPTVKNTTNLKAEMKDLVLKHINKNDYLFLYIKMYKIFI